jgi:hypothetical protein
MAQRLSTATWKPIDLPALRAIQGSTDMRELSRQNWPRWAAESTQFNRILAYSTSPTTASTARSTGVVARLLTERLDSKDWPQIYNYNFYLIAETTSGQLFQSSPIVPAEPKHRSSAPSTWFNVLGSPL